MNTAQLKDGTGVGSCLPGQTLADEGNAMYVQQVLLLHRQP